MRKAILVFLLIIGFVSSSLFAQTLDVEWGGFNDLPKNTRFNKTIGQDSDKFYLIRSEKEKNLKNSQIWLESISKTSMGVESSYEIKLPEIYTKKSKFEDIYYIDNKLVLFVSVDDAVKERKNLYVLSIDEDGIAKTDPKLVGSISMGLGDDQGFSYKLSPDKKKIIVHYHVMFTTYNGEPFYYKAIDSDLNIFEKKSFEMPYLQKKFMVVDYNRGESGNYYFAVRVEPVSKRRTTARGNKPVKKNYLYYLLVFNSTKDKFQEYKVEVEKYSPSSISMTLDEEENILLFGYGNKRSSIAFGGIYYQKLNPRHEKFVSKSFLDFYKDRSFMAEFKQERNGDGVLQWYSFTNGEVKFMQNGSKVFVSEQYYVSTRIIVDPKTKDETIIYYYNHNDIMVISFDEDDNPEWYRRIPKNQFSTNDEGYYSSYAVTTDANKIKLIYNDNSKNFKNKDLNKTKEIKNNVNTNPSGQAILTTIYSDGNIDKAKMFPGSDAKLSICPKFFIESDGQYFIYGQKGGKYKFGNFFFE